MAAPLGSKSIRAVIVAEAGSVRQMLSEVVRNLGFHDVVVLASGDDVLSLFAVEDCDWLILPMLTRERANALQILRIISESPRLRNIRTSLMFEVQEDAQLSTAFSLGLMSCHPKSYLKDDVMVELRQLQEVQIASGGKTVLVAAEYLRRHLAKAKQFDLALRLEENLLNLFPGSPALLLKLGEAQIQAGRRKEGLTTLHQATLIDEQFKEGADTIAMRLLNTKVGASKGEVTQNALGIETCVIVDADSAVLKGLTEMMQSVGVPTIKVFDNGTSAWDWLSTNPEPGLILQEWRIPGLSGPMLLQRVRDHGFARVPINVVSSTIKPKEVHLLREMGIDGVIPKPFERTTLFKSVVWTLQQNAAPTERDSLERKMGRLLMAGQLAEAERLKGIYMADQRIPTASKKLIDAEFAFHHGRFREACDAGIESLRLAGDSLRLLNLIGKSLIKLGDHATALKFFEKAHALSPANIEHLCNLAVCQFDTGNPAAAAEVLQQAKQLDAQSPMVGRTECQLAIMNGQTQKAREIMEKLASVGKIVAYMNNRAVALSRCGRYEEGIKLYQQTTESLPGTWGDTHDVVAYNLGLAYARYGELDAAAESLKRILARAGAPMQKKAHALLMRVRRAADTGGALTLHQVDAAEGPGAAAEADQAKTGGAAVKTAGGAQNGATAAKALEVGRGDLCLLGVFHAESMDPESKRMLEKGPHFVERTGDRPPTATGTGG